MRGARLHTALGVLCAEVVVRVRLGFDFLEIEIHVTFDLLVVHVVAALVVEQQSIAAALMFGRHRIVLFGCVLLVLAVVHRTVVGVRFHVAQPKTNVVPRQEAGGCLVGYDAQHRRRCVVVGRMRGVVSRARVTRRLRRGRREGFHAEQIFRVL